MIQISLLEEDDVIKPTDFCRPLSLQYSEFGDSIHTKATYSGTPINNMKWCRVQFILGPCWHGKKIKEYHSKGLDKLEFVRGCLPDSHLLDMEGYTII